MTTEELQAAVNAALAERDTLRATLDAERSNWTVTEGSLRQAFGEQIGALEHRLSTEGVLALETERDEWRDKYNALSTGIDTLQGQTPPQDA